MPKYLIEFTRFEASVVADFDNEGLMVSAVIKYGTMENNQIVFLHRNFPLNLDRIEAYKTTQNVKVSLVEEDLSFEAFWNAYKNKIGHKSRSNKLWELLKEDERIKALQHIARYDQELILRPGVVKKYPETYLAQKPWEN